MTKIKYQNQYEDVVNVKQFNINQDEGYLMFQVGKIEKLEKININIYFKQTGKQFFEQGVDMNFQIMFNDFELIE